MNVSVIDIINVKPSLRRFAMLSRRYIYIDILKSISIFLVIVNHTNSSIFLDTTPSPIWFASVFYFYLSKVAVPVFIMCTGALLLSKVDSYAKHIKRAWRGIVVLIISSFIYYHAGNGFHVTRETITSFIFYFINKPTSNALWYLYLYIGIVSVMPFLQRLASVLTKKDSEVLIVLSLVVPGLLSIVGHFMNVTLYERADFFIYSYPIGYLFAGYHINKYGSEYDINTKTLFLLLLTSVIIATAFTYFQFRSGYSVSLYWSYLSSLTVVIPSVSGFYAMMYATNNSKLKYKFPLIKEISLCTFGMYVFSDMAIILTEKYYKLLSCKVNTLVACIIWQISIFTLSLLASYIARKIPIVKKYL